MPTSRVLGIADPGSDRRLGCAAKAKRAARAGSRIFFVSAGNSTFDSPQIGELQPEPEKTMRSARRREKRVHGAGRRTSAENEPRSVAATRKVAGLTVVSSSYRC